MPNTHPEDVAQEETQEIKNPNQGIVKPQSRTQSKVILGKQSTAKTQGRIHPLNHFTGPHIISNALFLINKRAYLFLGACLE
jgi:hypothetical protein